MPLVYPQPSTVELERSAPLESGPASEPEFPAGDPAAPEEPAAHTAAARTAWGQLATHIMGPEDDATRRYGRRVAQIRNLEQDSSIVVHDNAFEDVWKPPVVGCRIENNSDNRAERDLEGLRIVRRSSERCKRRSSRTCNPSHTAPPLTRFITTSGRARSASGFES